VVALALVIIILASAIVGVWAGRAYWPRIVVQPITKIVERLKPGETITEIIRVPGSIRTVTRTVTKTQDRLVLVTRPPELTPAETTKAQEKALRRFILSLEIPAGQLIPCLAPRFAPGGMVCAEAIRFQAELLEPAPGVIVPIRLPGQIAQPTELRIEVRPEATAAVRTPGWYLYPLGVRTSVLPTVAVRLVSGVSYRGPLWRGTYEARAECIHPEIKVWSCSGLDLWLVWGMTF